MINNEYEFQQPSKTMERGICVEWGKERVPIHIRYIFGGSFRF
jgi:hypothetical protein